MKKTVLSLSTLAMLAMLMTAPGLAVSAPQLPSGPAFAEAGAEPHPLIYRAIHALEAARGDLQDAAHDYCGHRVNALGAINAALEQLHAAVACDERRDSSTNQGPTVEQGDYQAVSTAGGLGDRHPNIHAAVNALRSARGDLQGAAHDYCGHRVEALNATNAALEQLQQALRCDR